MCFPFSLHLKRDEKKISKRKRRHSVWKSQKKSHSILRVTFTFWVDKSSLKMPKIVNFGELLKTWSLRSNSVTRQVNLNRTKIGGKCRIQMRQFGQFPNSVQFVSLKTSWNQKIVRNKRYHFGITKVAVTKPSVWE